VNDDPLRCVIVVETNSIHMGIPDAEVQLTNVTNGALEIKYPIHPFRNLNFEVRDENNILISDEYYGLIYVSGFELQVLVLEPGETYKYPVVLFDNVSTKPIKPGLYKIQAVYALNERQIKSQEVQVRVPVPTKDGTGEK